MRECRPLGREGFQRGRIGIIERLARHGARAMLIAEHEQQIRPSRDLRPGGHRPRDGQTAEDISSGWVPRYHDHGILATPGRAFRLQLKLLASRAQ